MLADPSLKPLIESPTATCWIGHEGHVMSYPIRNGALYNFVMCHPGSVPEGKSNVFTSLDEMRERYKDWDPILTKLINLVPECLKWQNAEIEKLDTWVSKSGRVVLIGDSSHGMVPYMAQGAAMAVEDGIVIAECLARARSSSEIPRLMRFFEKLRLDRCYIILDAARNNGNIWHLADGPEQQKRDEQMRHRSVVKIASTATTTHDNPNKWSDPKFQPWMFGHDAFAHV
jgi:salicylate hydroxylase